MDQLCSGKTEISRNCGVREWKHAAVVELQMSWVRNTQFPQPEKRAESINSPMEMNPSSPLPHSGLPQMSLECTGDTTHTDSLLKKRGPICAHLGMDPGRGNQQYQHWSFTVCFNYFKLIPKLLRSILPGPFGFLCCPAIRLGVLAQGDGQAIPWWCPRGK